MFPMQRLRSRCALCLATSFLALFPIFAAAQVMGSIEGQPVPNSAEGFLREHHLSTTKQAVIAALKHDDPTVRRSAAEVLARRWPKEAVVPVETAMTEEVEPFTRVLMAFDLAKIGDRAGYEMLMTECHDTGEWGSTRIFAARSMTELHDNSCVDSVLEILRSPTDPQDTIAKSDALNLVPDIIRHSGQQEYRNTLDLTMNALNDPDGGVRLTACVTLGRLGDTSAIATLQAAVETEQDPNIHSVMLNELKRLKTVEQEQKITDSKITTSAPDQ
jgi:HEAT repeat protein